MSLGFQQLEEWMPGASPLFALHEGRHVADQDDAVAGSRHENVEPLRGRHEADVARLVAAGEGGNNDVALFALVVVCRGHG